MAKTSTMLTIVAMATILIEFQDCRPASKCDVDRINGKLSKLMSTIKQIEDKFGYINAYTKEMEEKEKAEKAKVEVHDAKQQKYIKDIAEKNYKDAATKYAGYYIHNRKHKLIGEVTNSMKSKGASVKARYENKRDSFNIGAQTYVNETEILMNEAREVRKQTNEVKKQANEALKRYSTVYTIEQLNGLMAKVSLLKEFILSHQFHEFERVRSSGISGLNKIPSIEVGSNSYDSNDYCGKDGLAGINDAFSNTKDKVAFGRADFLLNGVEFFIGNDWYELRSPSRNSQLDRTYRIPFPHMKDIESESLSEQIKKMREYFQEIQQRNLQGAYKSYMRVVLTYLEGFWKKVNVDDVSSKFEYCAETADPNNDCPSTDYLPTATIRKDAGYEKMSQWNYRVKTKGMGRYTLTKLRLMKDLTSQTRRKFTSKEYERSNCARFTLNFHDGKYRENEQLMNFTYQDRIIMTIPGKDNYPTESDVKRKFPDTSLTGEEMFSPVDNTHLDESFYYRSFTTKSGEEKQVCFSDQSYVAKTKQEEIVGPEIEGYEPGKVSNAIPLEVLIMSPLQNWNPYKLPEYDSCESVTGDGSVDNPYTGMCPGRFYQTPLHFFKDVIEDEETACEEHRGVFMKVENVNGVTKRCFVASGTRVVLPKIDGVDGYVRLRFPIMPFKHEGSALWKKLKAMWETYDHDVTFELAYATNDIFPKHKHLLKLTKSENEKLMQGQKVQKSTEHDSRHQHVLTIYIDDDGEYKIYSCDSGDRDDGYFCFDHHGKLLSELPF